MSTITAPSVVAAASAAAPKDVAIAATETANGSNNTTSTKNPPIVSPTPTPEDLSVAPKQLVIAAPVGSSSASAIKATKAAAKPKPLASSSSSAAPLKKKPKKASTSSAKHPRPYHKKAAATVATVGYHDENTSSSSKSSPPINQSEASSSSTNTTSSLSNRSSTHPPLISRYCGCCGDLLSTKAYGFDEQGCDRNKKYHPQHLLQAWKGTLNNNKNNTNNDKIQEAAETIQQNLLATKSRKSTKASRKKKKARKNSYWHFDRNHPHQQLCAALDPWPEESLQMDMTIVEGLMVLKHSPPDETDCSCFCSKKAASSKSLSPTKASATKKLKASSAAATKLLKTKVAAASKKKLKGPNSLTGAATSEVVSTKTVIVKCPKTGKKIKKTVRVVKKLIKKKRPLSKLPMAANKAAALAAAAAAGGGTSPSSSAKAKPTTPSSAASAASSIPSFSALGSAKKDSPTSSLMRKLHPSMADASFSKPTKKRLPPEDDEGSCSDDASDEGGSGLKKRRRNDEKADLDLRDRLMNCQLENGPLFPSQQELMELTTIRKRNALQTFYKRFNELRQFIAIFGDANVPQQFPENHSLGIWVNKMRMERKKWDTGSERTSLTERKIELLESIDFIWAQNHKGEIGWERRFQEIRKFKRKHGHCNVPTKSAENRALGRWVSTQRTMYKNYMKGFVGKSLTREEQERRIFLLLKEGFLFSMIPNGQSPNGGGEQQTGEDGETDDSKMDLSKAPSSLLQKLSESGLHTKEAMGDDPNPTAASDTAANALAKPVPTTSAPKATPEIPIETKNNAKDGGTGESTDGTNKNTTNGSDETKSHKAEEKAQTLSPSRPNKTMPKHDGTTEASSASPPPVSSIAQVSVTTTPSTTPSVSTAASPDRSPGKTISDEADSVDDNVATMTENTKMTAEESRKDGDIGSIGEMPVAPSLGTKSTTKHQSDAQSNLAPKSGVNSIHDKTTKSHGSSNGREKPTKSLKVNGASRSNDDGKNAKKEEILPRNERDTNTKENSLAKVEIKSKASPKPKPKAPDRIPLEKPQLITSDGLRIIVTMKDYEDTPAAESSPRPTKGTSEGSPSMAPSPSRRSVRARKPSARQLEAEKSPLRESILGR